MPEFNYSQIDASEESVAGYSVYQGDCRNCGRTVGGPIPYTTPHGEYFRCVCEQIVHCSIETKS